MDYSVGLAREQDQHDDFGVIEKRGAARFTSLIRAAKLITSQGEFICVIRDVSATGISLRTFHTMPDTKGMRLELQNGETHALTETRCNGTEASFCFAEPVVVERLIRESWNFPKRQLRLNIRLPLTLSSLMGSAEAETLNVSQQGARVECDMDFAIDQPLRVVSKQYGEFRAKVRWRKERVYGLVFESTYSLREFAMLAAAAQCPALLADPSQ